MSLKRMVHLSSLKTSGKTNEREREREQESTSQSIILNQSKEQIALVQDNTEVSATEKRKAPGLLSHYASVLNKLLDVASTLEARDYKGFGRQGMTGVIEYKSIKSF